MAIRRIFVAEMGVAASLLSGTAKAGIISTTGSVVNAGSPPASLVEGQSENPNLNVYTERTNFVLPSNVTANAIFPGNYTQAAGTFIIAAGTRVDSYIMHFDRVSGSGNNTQAGTITFDSPIIGIIGQAVDLNSSDGIVGAPGTTYDSAHTARRYWDPGDVDQATISADGKTLSLFAAVNDTSVDDLRILVPEPSTVALASGGILAMGMRRRRRST